MRIARGLFRLWLVLSVLWIAGVGIVTWQWLPADKIIWPGDPPRAVFDPNYYLADRSKPYLKSRDIERREAVHFAVVLALLPPAFLLALGSALLWVFRGFQS